MANIVIYNLDSINPKRFSELTADEANAIKGGMLPSEGGKRTCKSPQPPKPTFFSIPFQQTTVIGPTNPLLW